jgi:hypothetical protein
MNMNNKFGKCCNCPALNDGRIFTSYAPSKDYNNNFMRKLGTDDSNKYRDIIQNSLNKVKFEVVYDNFNDSTRCKNNGNNVFYERMDDIDKFFQNRKQ